MLLFLGFSGAFFHYILLAKSHGYSFGLLSDIQAHPAPSGFLGRSYPYIAPRGGERGLWRMSARHVDKSSRPIRATRTLLYTQYLTMLS